MQYHQKLVWHCYSVWTFLLELQHLFTQPDAKWEKDLQ